MKEKLLIYIAISSFITIDIYSSQPNEPWKDIFLTFAPEQAAPYDPKNNNNEEAAPYDPNNPEQSKDKDPLAGIKPAMNQSILPQCLSGEKQINH
jgi:hypothetical protein